MDEKLSPYGGGFLKDFKDFFTGKLDHLKEEFYPANKNKQGKTTTDFCYSQGPKVN